MGEEMSAADLRRRRRQERILANASSRISSITGVEGRAEPGLEDGPFKTSSLTTTDVSDKTNGGPPPKLPPTLRQMVGSPREEASFDFPAPAWHRRPRVLLAAALGLVFGLLYASAAAPGLSVWALWAPLLGGLELARLRTAAGRPQPPRGHLVGICLFAGASERAVKYGGMILEVASRLLNDTAVMFFVFLVTHLAVTPFIQGS